MSVKIYCYAISDENNVLNKTLGTATTYEGTFKDPLDVINPVIKINTSNNTFINFNYCKLDAPFNRYYFIKNVTILQNNIVQLTLHIDVLMSYKTGIKALKGTVDRQENMYNLYLNDAALKKASYPLIQTKAFTVGFANQYNFFLITAGG